MLSQTAIYAINAMAYIAKNSNGHLILTSEIAEQLQIPQNYLSKIMNRLVQSGYLKSRRGTKGGFSIFRNPSDISLFEVASLFMNTEDFNQCFLGLPKCDGTCGLHDDWNQMIEKFTEILKNNSILKA